MKAGPYLIAEIGVNHDGDPARAIEMALAAAEAGFDAVKLQHWVTEELLAPSAPNAAYQGAGDQHDLLAPLRLTVDALAAVRDACRRIPVDFGVTPDGVLACAEVLDLAPDFVKVGSGDADNPWLLDALAGVGQPLIVSTGMCTDDDVRAIADRLAGHADVTFLHCVSAYPTPVEHSNLRRMSRLAHLTGRPVGWSDHTIGVESAIAAVALGARVVEKHVTYDVAAVGPDHHMSLPLPTAATWTQAVKVIAPAVRDDVAEPAEQANRLVVRKALYVRRELPAGHVVAPDDLIALRPLLDGIPALDRDDVVGCRLATTVRPDAPLRPTDLA